MSLQKKNNVGLDQLNAIFGEEEPLSDVMDIVVQTHSGMSAYDCVVRIATGGKAFSKLQDSSAYYQTCYSRN